VESVIATDVDVNSGVPIWKVRWQGHGSDIDTWEPSTSFDFDPAEALAAYNWSQATGRDPAASAVAAAEGAAPAVPRPAVGPPSDNTEAAQALAAPGRPSAQNMVAAQNAAAAVASGGGQPHPNAARWSGPKTVASVDVDRGEPLSAALGDALSKNYRQGLRTIARRGLLPASADLLDPSSFKQVAESRRHQMSHGEETAAINRLREVFGVHRMKGGAGFARAHGLLGSRGAGETAAELDGPALDATAAAEQQAGGGEEAADQATEAKGLVGELAEMDVQEEKQEEDEDADGEAKTGTQAMPCKLWDTFSDDDGDDDDDDACVRRAAHRAVAALRAHTTAGAGSSVAGDSDAPLEAEFEAYEIEAVQESADGEEGQGDEQNDELGEDADAKYVGDAYDEDVDGDEQEEDKEEAEPDQETLAATSRPAPHPRPGQKQRLQMSGAGQGDNENKRVVPWEACLAERTGKWEQPLAELAAFKAMPEHRHCNVPQVYPPNPALGMWVSMQREQKRKYDGDPAESLITAERIAALDALGFTWAPHRKQNVEGPGLPKEDGAEAEALAASRSESAADDGLRRKISSGLAWQQRLVELAAFKAMPEHGHCRVPLPYPANPELASWVDTQRQQKRKYDFDPAESHMTAERIAALDVLGFAWSGNNWTERWEQRLAELAAFKAMPEHGHCHVPQGYPPNPQLGRWVYHQRQQKRKYDNDSTTSELTAERVAALEILGFTWSGDNRTEYWDKRLVELAAFKAMPKHGHCNVPQRRSKSCQHPQLATWVDTQRQQKRKYDFDPAESHMTAERVLALDALGFSWSQATWQVQAKPGASGDTSQSHCLAAEGNMQDAVVAATTNRIRARSTTDKAAGNKPRKQQRRSYSPDEKLLLQYTFGVHQQGPVLLSQLACLLHAHDLGSRIAESVGMDKPYGPAAELLSGTLGRPAKDIRCGSGHILFRTFDPYGSMM
jgi:hypothetical protein